MSELGDRPVAYNLLVDPDEKPLLAQALRLLISSEAHEPDIRTLARAVLERLDPAIELDPPIELDAVETVPLSPPELKITHAALRLALDDTVREQAAERTVLRRLIGKLPDEHAIRAIRLD